MAFDQINRLNRKSYDPMTCTAAAKARKGNLQKTVGANIVKGDEMLTVSMTLFQQVLGKFN